jgi:hypothetical protein
LEANVGLCEQGVGKMARDKDGEIRQSLADGVKDFYFYPKELG